MIGYATNWNPYGEDFTSAYVASVVRNGTAWEDILTLDTPVHNSLDRYQIDVSFLWGINITAFNLSTRLLRNGVDIGTPFQMSEEPTDSAGTGNAGTDQRLPAYLRAEFQGLEDDSSSTFILQSRLAESTFYPYKLEDVRFKWMKIE